MTDFSEGWAEHSVKLRRVDPERSLKGAADEFHRYIEKLRLEVEETGRKPRHQYTTGMDLEGLALMIRASAEGIMEHLAMIAVLLEQKPIPKKVVLERIAELVTLAGEFGKAGNMLQVRLESDKSDFGEEAGGRLDADD